MRIMINTLSKLPFWNSLNESQKQYIHDEASLTAKLEECGFTVKVYGDLTKRKPKQNALRLHFSAVKGSVNG